MASSSPSSTTPRIEATKESSAITTEHDDPSIKPFTFLPLTLITIPTVLTSFLVFLDSAIIVTAIPTITSDFGTIADIGWYSSVYLLSNCSVQPLLGKFYAHLPLKRTFLAFLAVFEVGSLVCGLADSSGMLIAGRALAGLGGAGVLNGSLAIISSSVPLEKRAAFLGATLGVGQLGTAFGPLIGGALTEYSTWRWNFYLNLPAGGFALGLLLLAPVPEYAESRVEAGESKLRSLLKLDWVGFALFASGVVMLLIALQWGSGSSKSWGSSTIIGLFTGAGLVTLVFFFWEHRRADKALMALSIISQRVVYSGCLTCFFQMGNMIITLYYLPLWFQVVKGKSPILSGVNLLPMIGIQIVATVISGLLAGRIGRFSIFCLINAALVAAGAGMTTRLDRNTTTAYWVGAELLIGAGRGCGLQMPFIAIQHALPPSDAAVGTSLAIFSQYFGGAIFSGISEAILVSSLTAALKKTVPGVNPHTVIVAGGRNLSSLFPPEDLAGILSAYNGAISHVFWLMTATGIIMSVSCLGMGWRKKAAPSVSET